VAFVSVKPVGA